MKTLYRIEGFGSSYEDGSSYVDIYIRSFQTIRQTPQGYWINDYGKDRWVSNNSKKRYAYPTVAEAKINFIKRKKKYLQILKSKVKQTEAILVEALKPGWDPSSDETRHTLVEQECDCGVCLDQETNKELYEMHDQLLDEGKITH